MTRVQDDGHELVLSLDPYFSQRIFCPHETHASEDPRLHEKHPCLHRVPATNTLIGKVEDLEGKWDYVCTVAQCAYDSGVLDCFEIPSMGGDEEGEFFRRRVGWYWTGGGEDAEMWLAFVEEPREMSVSELVLRIRQTEIDPSHDFADLTDDALRSLTSLATRARLDSPHSRRRSSCESRRR